MATSLQTVSDFIVGERYTNDQVRYALNLENLGGIRPSLGQDSELQHLAVMTTMETAKKRQAENPYEDRIENDVLLYTASGKEGDQTLAGKNKRLLEQYERPLPFYGFANEGRQIYRFLGLLELLRHYQEEQLDSSGQLRTAWIFEFRIHSEPPVVPIKNALLISAKLIAESRRKTPLVSADKAVIIAASPEKETEKLRFVHLEQLRAELLLLTPFKFEHLLKALIEKRGFQNVIVTKCSGDGGIDLSGYVPQTDDFFSGTFVQFQAKRWRHAVGSVEINNFRGALSASAKGVFVTTSHFTKAAAEQSRDPHKHSITLIDGQRLANMLQVIDLDLTPFKAEQTKDKS